MNLYLVSFVKKNIGLTDSPMMAMNREVYVVAEDPATAENRAFLLMKKVGIEIDYANNIRLVASTEEDQADNLLVVG